MVLNFYHNYFPPLEDVFILDTSYTSYINTEIEAYQVQAVNPPHNFDDAVIRSARTFSLLDGRRNSGEIKHPNKEIIGCEEVTAARFNHSNKRIRLTTLKRMAREGMMIKDYEKPNEINQVAKQGGSSNNGPQQNDVTFSCPICMGKMVEETSTKCGHIFCKACITAAIRAHYKCPICQKKTTSRGTHRIYLPTIHRDSYVVGE